MAVDIEIAAERLLEALPFPKRLVSVWAWTENTPAKLIVRLDSSIWNMRSAVPSEFLGYNVEIEPRSIFQAAMS